MTNNITKDMLCCAPAESRYEDLSHARIGTSELPAADSLPPGAPSPVTPRNLGCGKQNNRSQSCSAQRGPPSSASNADCLSTIRRKSVKNSDMPGNDKSSAKKNGGRDRRFQDAE
jgi:hypothetical protein